MNALCNAHPSNRSWLRRHWVSMSAVATWFVVIGFIIYSDNQDKLHLQRAKVACQAAGGELVDGPLNEIKCLQSTVLLYRLQRDEQGRMIPKAEPK